MGEHKKNRKFMTSILIGGALGSVAALVFGKKKKGKKGWMKNHRKHR